jgi:hypothetical protein
VKFEHKLVRYLKKSGDHVIELLFQRGEDLRFYGFKKDNVDNYKNVKEMIDLRRGLVKCLMKLLTKWLCIVITIDTARQILKDFKPYIQTSINYTLFDEFQEDKKFYLDPAHRICRYSKEDLNNRLWKLSGYSQNDIDIDGRPLEKFNDIIRTHKGSGITSSNEDKPINKNSSQAEVEPRLKHGL